MVFRFMVCWFCGFMALLFNSFMVSWFYRVSGFMFLCFMVYGFMSHGFAVFWFYGFLGSRCYQMCMSCFLIDIYLIFKIFKILLNGSSGFCRPPSFRNLTRCWGPEF